MEFLLIIKLVWTTSFTEFHQLTILTKLLLCGEAILEAQVCHLPQHGEKLHNFLSGAKFHQSKLEELIVPIFKKTVFFSDHFNFKEISLALQN